MRRLPIASPNRTCGNCTACCTALRVDEVEKKDHERCRHLGKLGCKIYGKRPDGCRAYECLWRQGLGTRTERPDRLGVVFSHMWSEKLGEHILLHEVRPGALRAPGTRAIVKLMVDHRLLFEVRKDGRLRLIGGPQPQVAEAIEASRERGDLIIEQEGTHP